MVSRAERESWFGYRSSLQCSIARVAECRHGVGVQLFRGAREQLGNVFRVDFQWGGVFARGNSTPFALRDTASACTAREQWVFTLPSVHPIVAAVSAVSRPSQ